MLAALGAVLLGVAFGALALRDDGGDGAGATPPAEVTLRAVSAVDPAGDGEHDAEVPNATDADRATYWTTQRYTHPNGEFGKPGVGIVIEASATPDALVVSTDTPGFTAEIRAGDAVVADGREVGDGTRFELPGDAEGPFTLWITNRGPHGAVRVNEVAAG